MASQKGFKHDPIGKAIFDEYKNILTYVKLYLIQADKYSPYRRVINKRDYPDVDKFIGYSKYINNSMTTLLLGESFALVFRWYNLAIIGFTFINGHTSLTEEDKAKLRSKSGIFTSLLLTNNKEVKDVCVKILKLII